MKGTAYSRRDSAIPLGCFHGDDTLLVFGEDALLIPPDGTTTSQQMRTYSDNAIQAWTSFSKGE